MLDDVVDINSNTASSITDRRNVTVVSVILQVYDLLKDVASLN